MAVTSQLQTFIVEEHDQALHHIYRLIGKKKISLSGITLLHFDAHPDLSLPESIFAADTCDKDILFSKLSIENWILPAVFAGHFSTIIWAKPSWSFQINDKSISFYVGKNVTSGELRVSCSESYFLSEGQYSPEEELEDKRLVTLHVITFRPDITTLGTPDINSHGSSDIILPNRQDVIICGTGSNDSNHVNNDLCKTNDEYFLQIMDSRKHKVLHHMHDIKKNNEDRVELKKSRLNLIENASVDESDSKENNVKANYCSNIEQVINLLKTVDKQSFVVDIDLDFFSTGNPFRETFSKEQYELLSKIYAFTPATDNSKEAINNCAEQRKLQLDKLKKFFARVQVSPFDLSFVDNLDGLDIAVQLVQSLLEVQAGDKAAIDFEWIHVIGSGIDGIDLPEHRSTLEEIKSLVNVVCCFLSAISPPAAITVARSAEDNYCPADQVDFIQQTLLDSLSKLYGNLNVQLNYRT